MRERSHRGRALAHQRAEVTIPVVRTPERVTGPTARVGLRAPAHGAKLPARETAGWTLPSSSGLGRGPLKAKTRVRLPLGAPLASPSLAPVAERRGSGGSRR